MPDESFKSRKPPANVANPAKDWGLPIWRDEASYGDVSKWSRMQWRWEFFRRRDDLREFFDEWARPDEAYVSPPTDKRPFNFVGAREKFGYLPVPNPRMSEHQFDLIWSQSSGISTVDGDPKRRTLESALRYAELELPDWQASLLRDLLSFKLLKVDENELGIVFDLDKPIEAQLTMAKESLSFQQEMRHAKKLQRRKATDKWLEYLRVLDARECGASWSEIAVIFRYKQKNPLTARDTWQQARDLCFNFPY